jgi:hypothetical protein
VNYFAGRDLEHVRAGGQSEPLDVAGCLRRLSIASAEWILILVSHSRLVPARMPCAGAADTATELSPAGDELRSTNAVIGPLTSADDVVAGVVDG